MKDLEKVLTTQEMLSQKSSEEVWEEMEECFKYLDKQKLDKKEKNC